MFGGMGITASTLRSVSALRLLGLEFLIIFIGGKL